MKTAQSIAPIFMRRSFHIALICLSALILITLTSFLERRKISDENLILYGNVDVREVDLGFQVTGRVIEMTFEEGDFVPKGSFMATLDKQPYLDKVLEAEAFLLSAQYEYKNAEEIVQRRQSIRTTGAISDEDYTNALSSKDIAFAKVKEAEAALGVATTNLRNTDLYAPSDGTILTRIREPGTVVNIADPIYTLSVLSPVWVRAYVSEPELGLIYPGMKAEIETDTPGGKIYEGHIGFISPVAEFTPKTVQTTSLRTDLVYRLRIITDNPDQFLKQGMPVTVKLKIRPQHNDTQQEK